MTRPDTAAAAGLDRSARVSGFIERALRVPSGHRTFTSDRTRARRVHALTGDLLTELLDAGLPHAIIDGAVRLDDFDLANASLYLGLSSPRTMAMRGWASAFNVAVGTRRRVTVKPVCRESGHAGPCRMRLGPAIGKALHHTGDVDSVRGISIDHVIRTGSVHVPPAAQRLSDLVADVEFFQLPWAMYRDVAFLRANRLGDCSLTAEYLTRAAPGLGLRARKAFGFLIAVPYSVNHVWTEVLVDGTWHAIDPLLIRLLVAAGVLDEEQWGAERTLGGAALRLHDDVATMVLHVDGQGAFSAPAEFSLPTV